MDSLAESQTRLIVYETIAITMIGKGQTLWFIILRYVVPISLAKNGVTPYINS